MAHISSSDQLFQQIDEAWTGDAGTDDSIWAFAEGVAPRVMDTFLAMRASRYCVSLVSRRLRYPNSVQPLNTRLAAKSTLAYGEALQSLLSGFPIAPTSVFEWSDAINACTLQELDRGREDHARALFIWQLAHGYNGEGPFHLSAWKRSRDLTAKVIPSDSEVTALHECAAEWHTALDPREDADFAAECLVILSLSRLVLQMGYGAPFNFPLVDTDWGKAWDRHVRTMRELAAGPNGNDSQGKRQNRGGQVVRYERCV